MDIQPECPHGFPEIENSTHVLLHCPHYSVARRELKNEIEKLKLPFDVPTLTGVNFSIPKQTQEKIAKSLINFTTSSKIIKRI
ncbi:hypothetical protein DAPPUDRAFT_249804 [Daphnia pulex]|uniref:Uncharacterized protein n=1 Tax=Daphnia pulex TaxID=6669 RepID=E9GXB9_DAPPU|nr:hypothetical protein DAPPUDRAFT_249804 [Daphnia pulex]|eukprot:EFX75887.1 hypothetical protein DAPPUDRAFT_249804 [Daphnia pulex]